MTACKAGLGDVFTYRFCGYNPAWFLVPPQLDQAVLLPPFGQRHPARVGGRSSVRAQAPLFPEDNILAQPYHYDVHFHNQLKARLLEHNTPTQIIRESTIAQHEVLDRFGNPTRQLDTQSAIAWNLSTATFYKAGGRPWKLMAIRRGVCYIGLAFKVDEKSPDPRSACCAAQMFLHGKVRFNDEEWRGFIEGTDSKTQLVGVRIREDSKGSHKGRMWSDS